MLSIQVSDLARLKANDLNAWEAAFLPLWNYVCGVVRTISHSKSLGLSEEDIEEVASDTILNMIKAISSVNDLAHLRRLLWTIATAQAVDKFRKTMAAKRGVNVSDSLDAMMAQTGDADLGFIDGEIERQMLAAEITQALEKLEKLCRDLLKARFLDDKSCEELAALSHINVGALRKRTFDCLNRLREICKRENLLAR